MKVEDLDTMVRQSLRYVEGTDVKIIGFGLHINPHDIMNDVMVIQVATLDEFIQILTTRMSTTGPVNLRAEVNTFSEGHPFLHITATGENNVCLLKVVDMTGEEYKASQEEYVHFLGNMPKLGARGES